MRINVIVKENEMKISLLSICTMLLSLYGTECSARYVDTSSPGTVDELRSRFGKKGGFKKSYVSTENQIVDSDVDVDENISDSEENNVDRIRKNFGKKGSYKRSWLPRKDSVKKVEQSEVENTNISDSEGNKVDRVRRNFGAKGHYKRSWLPKKANVEEVDQSKIEDATIAQEQPKPVNSKNRKNAKRNSKGKRKIRNR
jgi:hypothetical protein